MAVRYWLDTNCLIESKNRWYFFQIVPGFWSFLDRRFEDETIAASSLVYAELVRRTDDELAQWARERQGPPYFLEPDEAVQEAFASIANHVRITYESRRAEEFLSGADGWEIAHVMAKGGVLVTMETKVEPTARKVKIPNVCQSFDVQCCDLFQC
jgi:predicted nucleic acid-binding protein